MGLNNAAGFGTLQLPTNIPSGKYSLVAYTNWMKNFDEVMSGPSFGDPENGYRKYIKTKSFIDMLFLNEISKGIEAVQEHLWDLTSLWGDLHG